MGLTHFDENGKAVMVDVTDKKETAREAVAEGKILENRDVFQAVKAGTVGKGDVLAVAATAGIAGAKRTSDLFSADRFSPTSPAHRSKSFHISPLLPPVFFKRWISVISIFLSNALHIS